MLKDQVKKKVRKTLLYSALFTIVFSGSAAISYYLTPSKSVAYEPPATSQGGTTSQPGTPGQTDHLSKLLARLESLPGIDGNLEGSVTFPKTSGSDELSTATIDADFILSLADSNDYAFSLDLEAGLNGSTKKISAAYIENELSFDLLGAKFYSDEEDGDAAMDHLEAIFGEEIFVQPDIVGLIGGNGDLSSLLAMFGGISVQEQPDSYFFDISLLLEEGVTSHVYLTTDLTYFPTDLYAENLSIGGVGIDLKAKLAQVDDGKAAIRAALPSNYEAAGYRKISNSLGLVDRLYSLYETPRFGLELDATLVNEKAHALSPDTSSLSLGLEGQVDILDGAFDAGLSIAGNGASQSLELGYRAEESSESGRAYLAYGDAMKLRMSMLTLDSVIATFEDDLPADPSGLLDVLLFNDQLKAIAAGEYEKIIDAVKGFTVLDDNLLRFDLGLSGLGLGSEAAIAVTIDGREADQGFAGSEATIEASGLSLGGFAIDLTLKTTPYTTIKDVDFASYDSLDGLPTIFEQVKGLVNSKQAGFEIKGSFADESGYGLSSLNGRIDFDLGKTLAGASLTLGEKSASVDREHNLVLDIDQPGTEPYLRFQFNETMNGKMAFSTFGGIVDLATGLLNSEDERYDAFLDPLREMMVDTIIDKLMNGEIGYVASLTILDSLRVTTEEIRVVLDLSTVGLESQLTIAIGLNSNGEAATLSLGGLTIGESTLDLSLTLVPYAETNVHLLNDIDSSSFMDFSSLDEFLGTALDTAALETYHFENGQLDITALGGLVDASGIDMDADVRVDGANVEAYVHLGGLRNGALAAVTEGHWSFIPLRFSSRDTYIYYDGRDGRSDLYIQNVEHWDGKDYINLYKHTADDFLANPMYIIMKEIFSFNDTVYNGINGSVDDDPNGKPIAYEQILKNYAYDEATKTYNLTIGLPALLQSNALTDAELSIGTSEVGGRTYLSTLAVNLGLASLTGEAGTGVAKIALKAALSSIGEDVFWNQEGNAYATYLGAHGGDAYTVL